MDYICNKSMAVVFIAICIFSILIAYFPQFKPWIEKACDWLDRVMEHGREDADNED